MTRLAAGILVLLTVFGSASAAPKTETFDVTTFTPPSGWTRTAQDERVELSIANNTAGAAASIRIYSATAAGAAARANFDKAWSEVVTLADVPAPTVAAVVKRDGWDVVRGSASYTFSGRAATTTLLAATRDSSYVLVVATMVGPTYRKDADKVLASLKFAAPPVVAAPAPATPAPPASSSAAREVTGGWGYSTGGPLGYGVVGGWLRESREYLFDGKGNYTFLRRYDVDQESETTLVRERGTYTLTSDTLTIAPTKSEREVWAKNVNNEKSPYKKLLKREKLALEKVTYRIGLEPDEDKKIVNLVLTPPAATTREGIFNASGRYRLFRPDGTYYTPITPTP